VFWSVNGRDPTYVGGPRFGQFEQLLPGS
jgi:hypothetical protein